MDTGNIQRRNWGCPYRGNFHSDLLVNTMSGCGRKHSSSSSHQISSASTHRASASTNRTSASTRATSISSLSSDKKAIGAPGPRTTAEISEQQRPRTRSTSHASPPKRRKLASPSPEPSKTKESGRKKKGNMKPEELGPRDPRQQIRRRPVKIKDLDLDKSYVGVDDHLLASKEPESPPRQRRWRHRRAQPLIGMDKLPPGWNSKEPDLSEK
jgi:hypothetical protein